MKIQKRIAVIKRRVFHWLILKTQAPEYYGRLQCRIRELERELQSVSVRLDCAQNNERFYREQRDKMCYRLRSLKETRRTRGFPC